MLIEHLVASSEFFFGGELAFIDGGNLKRRLKIKLFGKALLERFGLVILVVLQLVNEFESCGHGSRVDVDFRFLEVGCGVVHDLHLDNGQVEVCGGLISFDRVGSA